MNNQINDLEFINYCYVFVSSLLKYWSSVCAESNKIHEYIIMSMVNILVGYNYNYSGTPL